YAGDFPYDDMVKDLKANPDMDALQSVTAIFNKQVTRLQARDRVVGAVPQTSSVMDLARIPDVSVNIRAWADLLAPGMSLFQQRDDPADNVQVLTKKQVAESEKFYDNNVIDLYHFASLMKASGIPNCLLSPVQSILDLINPANKRAVILEYHGAGHPNAHG